MPLVEAKHLVKTFATGQSALGLRASGLVRAVNAVSLAIDAGETLGLVATEQIVHDPQHPYMQTLLAATPELQGSA
jgi:ABC-type oligopeptide transport system ATPase subunit